MHAFCRRMFGQLRPETSNLGHGTHLDSRDGNRPKQERCDAAVYAVGNICKEGADLHGHRLLHQHKAETETLCKATMTIKCSSVWNTWSYVMKQLFQYALSLLKGMAGMLELVVLEFQKWTRSCQGKQHLTCCLAGKMCILCMAGTMLMLQTLVELTSTHWQL